MRGFQRMSMLVSAVAIAGTTTVAAQSHPNFAGTWRMTSREVIKSGHEAHGAAPKTSAKSNEHVDHLPAKGQPHSVLTITQSADSLTLDRKLLSPDDSVLAFAGNITFRAKGEWSGPYHSPPGSTARTSMKWIDTRTLQLTTVASRTAGDGTLRSATTTETWRLNPDGTLRREVHELMANKTTNDIIETYKRAP
jgi:hypothetical protein